MTMSVDQMKLALEQKIQEQIQESNEQLNNIAIAPNVLSAIHGQVTDLLGSTVGASAPAAAPKPSVGDPYSPTPGGGYIDQLVGYIEDIQNNPNDPTAVLNFINFLTSGKIDLNDSTVQATLQGFGINQSMLNNMMRECILYQYYMPTSGDITGQPGGITAAQSYINMIMARLNGMPASPIASEISGGMSAFNLTAWDQACHQGNNYIYSILTGDGVTGQVLTWNVNPNGDSTDNFTIMEMIGNCQLPGQGPTSNPYVNSDFAQFMKTYRMNAINAIWAQTHNPSILLMYFMMMYDNDYQSQEGGLGNTTNLLTGMTNNYANQLLALANQFGTAGQGGAGINAQQAQDFVRYLESATAVMNSESQTSSIAGNWQTNVYNQIMNLQISTGGQGSPTQSLGSIIDNYLQSGDPSSLVNALNSLNPAPNGSSPNYNPGFQSMLSSLQTGGGLITGTSKMVNTELSTVSSLDSQVVKLGSSTAASDGGGFMQMILAIINNFMSR